MKDKNRKILFILFFASGISALVYEVVWTRMLTVIFGNTVFAVSTVLASFMAGLALGSLYFGRFIDRYNNVLKIYVFLEGGIGASALLLTWLLGNMDPFYIWVWRHFNTTFYSFSLIRLILSFCLLLLPTILMGGTLPVLSKYFVKKQSRLGWNIGALYGLNTLGAAVGSFCAGFLLVGTIGVRESAYVAAAINLLVAGVAWLLAKKTMVETEQEAAVDRVGVEDMPQDRDQVYYSKRILILVLWVFAFSGFAALAYEVIWTRALVFFLSNTTYTFATILTTFLCGIPLGSFIAMRFCDRQKNPLIFLGFVEVLIGFSAILILPVLTNFFYENLFAVMELKNNYISFLCREFGISFVIMLVPAILMGITFPLVSKIVTTNLRKIGRSIGRVYSVNTLGAIGGSIVAGFLFIPLIGIQKSIFLVAFINILMGGLIIFFNPAMRLSPKCLSIIGLVFILKVGITAIPLDVKFRRNYESWQKLLYYKEGISATVKVYQQQNRIKILSIDGFQLAGTGTKIHRIYPEAQKMLGHLPLLLHKDPNAALLIGFGTGGSSWAVSQYNIEEIDCVEIVPSVIEAAYYFPEVNHNIFSDDRFNLIIDDGRNYLLVVNKQYDIISVDATDPMYAGNGNLYTKEFYELCKKRLSKDGIMVQWLPFHCLSEEQYKIILKTFHTIFPNGTIWMSKYARNTLLVGTKQELKIDFELLQKKFQNPGIKQELEEINIDSPFAFLNCFLMDKDAIAEFVKTVRKINSYYYPHIEFFQYTSYKGYFGLFPVEKRSGFPKLLIKGQDINKQSIIKKELVKYLQVADLVIYDKYLAGRHKNEREYLYKALNINPEDESVKYILGITKAHKKFYLDAIKKGSRDFKTYTQLANIYRYEKEYDLAIKTLQEAISLKPDDWNNYTNLASVYLELEDYDKVIRYYEMALQLDPSLKHLEEKIKGISRRLNKED